MPSLVWWAISSDDSFYEWFVKASKSSIIFLQLLKNAFDWNVFIRITVLGRLICNFHFDTQISCKIVAICWKIKLSFWRFWILRKSHIWKCKKFPNFHCLTFRFYFKSNLAILGCQKLQFYGNFEGPKVWYLRKFHIW